MYIMEIVFNPVGREVTFEAKGTSFELSMGHCNINIGGNWSLTRFAGFPAV